MPGSSRLGKLWVLVAERKSAPLSTTDTGTPPDTADTSVRTTSEVVTPKPAPLASEAAGDSR